MRIMPRAFMEMSPPKIKYKKGKPPNFLTTAVYLQQLCPKHLKKRKASHLSKAQDREDAEWKGEKGPSPDSVSEYLSSLQISCLHDN